MNTMNTIVICHDLIWELDNYAIHMYSWGFLVVGPPSSLDGL